MRISGHAMNTQASAALAVGLIVIPVAATRGHPVAPHGPPRSVTHSPSRAAAPDTRADHQRHRRPSRGDGRRPAHLHGERARHRHRGRAAPQDHPDLVPGPGVPVGQRQRCGHGRAGRLARQPSPGGTQTFRVTALVTQTPARELRLAAVACVVLPDGSPPVVCAAHLDQLPAAAAAPAWPASCPAATRRCTGRRPDRARRSPAHGDRRPPPPAAAAAGLTGWSGRRAAALKGVPPHDDD